MGNPVPLGEGDLIDIAHTGRFVLVDGDGAIRGYYEGRDEAARASLLRDIGILRRSTR